MQFIVEPVWSWPLTVIAALALLGTVLWTYPKRLAHLPKLTRYSLLSLRVLAALVLIFAMLRPAVQFEETDQEVSQLLILADRSRSMSTPDAPGGMTRREAIRKTIEDNQELIDKLADEVEIRLIDFDTELAAVDEIEETTDGNFTAIGKSLDLLREQERNDRLLAVVIMSDGAQRAGGDDDIDPVSAARRFAEQRGVPVHSVVYGTSELSTGGLDLAIEDLSLDQPETFEQKTVPVRLQVRALGASQRDVRVRLLVEDRTGKSLGESGELVEIPLSAEATPFKDLRITENATTIPLELSFVAERAGEYKIAAEVVPQNGEVKLGNNRLETLITVRKGGLRVAYFDVPRPEQKFLRRLNETAKIQLDTQVILPGALGTKTLLDDHLFDPDVYDVYIIGDVPAEVFTRNGANFLDRMAARVDEGAGLAMIGGLHNFGAGGYAGTPLAPLLPVKMAASDRIDIGEDNPRGQFSKAIQMLPTPDGERHYLMRLGSTGESNLETWRSLPKMGGANRLEPKSGAIEVLAESAGGDALIMATDTGTSRVLAIAADETWKWHLHGHQAEHQRFWQQLVLWLARKEFESDQPVWVRVEPRNFSPGAKVPIEFGAQDEDGNPIIGANYTVEVVKPDGTIAKVPARRFDDHGLADFQETLEPGDYWVRVGAVQDGNSLGMSVLSRFIIDARDLELDNPAADPGMLSQISAMTGGNVIAPEEFGAFLEQLLEEGIPAELQRFRRVNLWDGWPLLLIFILLMTIEWTVRKLRGLV